MRLNDEDCMNWNLSITHEADWDRHHIVAESGEKGFLVTINGTLTKSKIASAFRNMAAVIDGALSDSAQ